MIKCVDWLKNQLYDSIMFKSDDMSIQKYEEIKSKNKDMKYVISWIDEFSNIKTNDTAKEQFKENIKNIENKNLSNIKDIKAIIENHNNNDKNKIKNNFSKNSSISSNNATITIFSSYITFPSELIDDIEEPSFDIFSLESHISQNTLPCISIYIFNLYGFYSLINYKTFEKFITKITKGYIHSNPYHNDIHAADVTQTCMMFFQNGNINNIINLDKYNLCALFLSCMIHDYKHPGYTNNFLTNSNNDLAIMYNDKSILENFHVAQTFELIYSNEKYNIFKDLNKNEMNTIRKKMINCVLATDMVHHARLYTFCNINITKFAINEGKNVEKIFDNLTEIQIIEKQQDFMDLLIHSSDVSNPTKPFNVYMNWANKVMSEFYRQGDKEKEMNLPVSFLCDRENTNLPKGQIGFIEGVVLPFYMNIIKFFPLLKFTVENCQNNKKLLMKMLEEEKEQKKKEDNKDEINNNNEEKLFNIIHIKSMKNKDENEEDNSSFKDENYININNNNNISNNNNEESNENNNNEELL